MLRRLRRLRTNEVIREATLEESRASARASQSDNGVGAIEMDGVPCYVDAPCPDCDQWDCVCVEEATG